jgi:hypothetical protein
MSINWEDLVVWEDPPETPRRRADLVAELLRVHPGRWALIDTTDGGVSLAPWWGPLNAEDSPFEVRTVPVEDSTRAFPPRKIYARFRADSPSTEQLPPDALLG